MMHFALHSTARGVLLFLFKNSSWWNTKAFEKKKAFQGHLFCGTTCSESERPSSFCLACASDETTSVEYPEVRPATLANRNDSD